MSKDNFPINVGDRLISKTSDLVTGIVEKKFYSYEIEYFKITIFSKEAAPRSVILTSFGLRLKFILIDETNIN